MGSAIAVAQSQPGSGTNAGPGDEIDGMMSNAMIPGFDPYAGLRTAQASHDPTKRIETLARPGTTTIELAIGGHSAEAEVDVLRLPGALDLETWPGTTLFGDYNTDQPYAIAEIMLRIDGCTVEMPWPQPVLASPSSVELANAHGLWTLTIGSADSYTFSYQFDRKGVSAQRFSSSAIGTYDADWKIKRDDYGETVTPECLPRRSRRHGARAELKAGVAQ